MASTPHLVFYLCLVFVAAVLVYWNSLNGAFAYDDSRAIVGNQDLRPESPWTSLLLHDFWGTPLRFSGSHKSYRPLTVATFRLNYLLSGLEPFWYHAVNVGLHALVSVSVSILCHHLLYESHPEPKPHSGIPHPGSLHSGSTHSGCTRIYAFFCGLLFALHPIHTEAVAGLVGRSELCCALFSLVSFLAFSRHISSRNRQSSDDVTGRIPGTGSGSGFLVMSLAAATAAMLSKEQGISILAVLVVYDVLVRERVTLRDLPLLLYSDKYSLLRRATVSVIGFGFLLLFARLAVMGFQQPSFSSSDNPVASCDSCLTRLLTLLYLPAFNTLLMLCPIKLNFDWSADAMPLVSSIADHRNILSVVFYAGVGCAIVKLLLATAKKTDSDEMSPKSVDVNGNQIFLVKCGNKSPMGTNPCNLCNDNNNNNNNINKNNNSNNLKQQILNDAFETAQSQSSKLSNDGHGYSSASWCSWSQLYLFQRSKSPVFATAQTDKAYSENSGKTSFNQINCSQQELRANGYCNKSPTAMYKAKFQGSQLLSHPMVFLNTENVFDPVWNTAVVAIAITVFSFLPAAQLFFYVGFYVAERVLYLPSVGLCLLVSVGVKRFDERFSRRSSLCRQLFRLSLIALLLCYGSRTWLRNRDWQSEEQLYRSGIEMSPAKAYSNLGNVLSMKADADSDAELAYRLALRHRPNLADAHYNLGLLMQKQERYDEATQSYRNAIACRRTLAVAHLNLGLVLQATGDEEEAEKTFRHCATLSVDGLKDPKSHENAKLSCLYNLGALLASQRKYDDALVAYMSAVTNLNPHYSPHSLFNMIGEVHLKQNNLQLAEHWYRRSLTANPKHLAAHFNLAQLLCQSDRRPEALGWLKRAAELAPESISVHQNLGQFFLDTSQFDESLKSFRKAENIRPNNFETTFAIANVLRLLGRSSKAEEYYHKLVIINPTSANAHMNLGAILHLNGKYVEAEAEYLTTLQLDPNDAAAKENLRKLKRLKRSR